MIDTQISDSYLCAFDFRDILTLLSWEGATLSGRSLLTLSPWHGGALFLLDSGALSLLDIIADLPGHINTLLLGYIATLLLRDLNKTM